MRLVWVILPILFVIALLSAYEIVSGVKIAKSTPYLSKMEGTTFVGR